MLAREGRHARRRRAYYHGHKMMEASRDALAGGSPGEGWTLLRRALVAYPGIVTTRAFYGTIQRLLRLR